MIRTIILAACLTTFIGCKTTSNESKIHFDLVAINEAGFVGPKDRQHSIDYEFCIPKGDSYTRQVMLADPSVRFYPGSRGRIGCSKSQILCVGSTGSPNWRGRLSQLETLPYIREIRRTHRE